MYQCGWRMRNIILNSVMCCCSFRPLSPACKVNQNVWQFILNNKDDAAHTLPVSASYARAENNKQRIDWMLLIRQKIYNIYISKLIRLSTILLPCILSFFRYTKKVFFRLKKDCTESNSFNIAIFWQLKVETCGFRDKATKFTFR